MEINIVKHKKYLYYYDFNMRVISKIICWIFLAFALFIIVNLILWVIQYWWTKNYSKYLNEKSRDDSVEQVYILRPKTWLSIFYEVDWIDIEKKEDPKNVVEPTDLNENASWDSENLEENTVNHNPYDPDYEDEFNSFFWVTSEDNTWEIISVQEIENLETAGFVDESTEN